YEELKSAALRPRLIFSERLGTFTGRSIDIGVVLDLMIHDLDLVLDLVGSAPLDVDAVGWPIHGKHEDVAHARLHFADGREARLSAGRASSIARRQMQVWGGRGYASVDFATRSLALIEETPPMISQAPELENSAVLPVVPYLHGEEVRGRSLRPERAG